MGQFKAIALGLCEGGIFKEIGQIERITIRVYSICVVYKKIHYTCVLSLTDPQWSLCTYSYSTQVVYSYTEYCFFGNLAVHEFCNKQISSVIQS